MMIRSKLDKMYEETTTASGRKAEIFEACYSNGRYWYKLFVDGEKVAFGPLWKIDKILKAL